MSKVRLDTTKGAIVIELERPTPVRLPGSPPKGGEREVDEVRIWVDDPVAFMAAVRQHM